MPKARTIVAAIKVSDVLSPKGCDEMPVNSHIVPARKEPEPDYDAMRRIVSGELKKVNDGDERKQ